MVSELSRKVDQLDAEIKKHNSNLDRLEDGYNFQGHRFEEESYGTSKNCEKIYVIL